MNPTKNQGVNSGAPEGLFLIKAFTDAENERLSLRKWLNNSSRK